MNIKAAAVIAFLICTQNIWSEQSSVSPVMEPEIVTAGGNVDDSEAEFDTGDSSEINGTDGKRSMPVNLSVAGRVLEDSYEGMLDMLLTVHANESSSLSLDLRASFLEDLEQEANAGIVFRHLGFNDQAIIGLNAFYDYRWTEKDHEFDQIGVGVELLSRGVDFRANYYHPLGDAEVISEGSSTSSTRTGGKILTTTAFSKNYEEPLGGYDAEVGFWLPFFTNDFKVAVFAGYFDFDSDYVDDDSFSGFKTRIEARLNKHVTLDYEWLEEADLNQSEHIAGIRFHVGWGGRQSSASGGDLSYRMVEMVNRDFRIRTIETGPIDAGQSIFEQSVRQPAPEPEIVCRDEFVTDPITGITSVQTICE